MNGKHIAFVVLLIAVIVGAGFFIKRHFTPKFEMPEEKASAPVTKIDMNTLEVVTRPYIDWVQKYPADWRFRYKSPKTGQNTMVEIVKCASCDAQIPALQVPDELLKQSQDTEPGHDPAKALNEMSRLQKEWKCPKCGKNPYGFR